MQDHWVSQPMDFVSVLLNGLTEHHVPIRHHLSNAAISKAFDFVDVNRSPQRRIGSPWHLATPTRRRFDLKHQIGHCRSTNPRPKKRHTA
jgi:hypothetical protein